MTTSSAVSQILESVTSPGPTGPNIWPMRFESHFKSYFGNVKAFNLKKLKLSLSPSPQWPEVALRLGGDGGKFLKQSLGRTVFGLESFESIPETSKSSVETCTWAI